MFNQSWGICSVAFIFNPLRKFRNMAQADGHLISASPPRRQRRLYEKSGDRIQIDPSFNCQSTSRVGPLTTQVEAHNNVETHPVGCHSSINL
jgi:hypothetical protein